MQMIGDVIARNTLLQPQGKKQDEKATVRTWQDLPMKKRRRISRVIIPKPPSASAAMVGCWP
ncbi:hypothetical protein FHY26_002120 [Xanthomonas campestris]